MNKCAVFDLDGTLLDTVNTIAYHVNKTLEYYSLPTIENEKFNYFAGNGARVLIKRSLNEIGYTKEENFEEIYSHYLSQYESDVKIHTKVFDGIKDLLSTLGKLGYKTAVLSNKPDKAVCDTIGLYFGDTFDFVMGASEDIPKKPDPAMLDILAKALDMDRKNSIYLGDTGVDMQTGKNGGLFTIGVLWGFRTQDELEQNGADAIAAKPSDVINLIESNRI